MRFFTARKKCGLLFFSLVSFGASSTYSHAETARVGSPDSWKTAEFNNQWGLESIGAHYAYAKGYNGEGVNIGVLDAKLFPHPEFTGKLTLVSDYLPYDFDIKESGIITFEDHGAHVAGIAAANRDGTGMHGVAFGATLTTGSIPNQHNQLEFMTQSNVRVINNSWGENTPIEKDATGNNLFLPNGTWKFKQITPASQIDALAPFREHINALSQGTTATTIDDEAVNYAGMLRAARHGKLIVFATGNSNNYNVPMKDASLPYLFPEVLDRYLTVTNLAPNDDLDASSTSCGHTASYCVSAPGANIYSAGGHFISRTGGSITETAMNQGELSVVPGYIDYSGTSMAAPHVTGAAAVLMQRFPYMTAEQISTVLKTTATDLGAPGIDARFGWGKINLKDAIDGPKMLIAPADIPAEFYVPGSYTNTQFVANIPGIGAVVEPGTPVQRLCSGIECGYDSWVNDIAGHGGLTKVGAGTLALMGSNTYHGPTLIKQGRLAVDGSVTSDVSVQNSGTLGGSGSVGSLHVYRGGTVSPGNPRSMLSVVNNLIFEPGSRYAVEVSSNGRSDRLQSGGLATLDGGEVTVSLENSGNLLSQNDVRSLLGQQYNILTAQQGVSGQFDTVVPNYLFLGTGLSYQPNHVMLSVGRNNTSFASVAQTQNEHAVAVAADKLAVGNPVYESILSSSTVGEVRQAFRQLSGKIHADIASALVNNSRYLRETLNGRLRQAEGLTALSDIKVDKRGGWAQLLGAWDRASGDANASGYQASTYGVLLGMDSSLSDGWRLGGATGYTRTSLGEASSDNYHLATYGSHQSGALALRAGGGLTWHRIDTVRTVRYGSQSDRATAKYGARTGQLFAEAGYGVKTDWANLEPFASLAYINFQNSGITEKGGAAALHGNKQHTDATLSTLGLRADSRWHLSKTAALGVHSELGWQHQYGALERGAGLSFRGGHSPFVVNSVPVSRDGAVVKISAEVTVKDNAALSLGYGGVLSKNHQENSINAGFTYHF